MSRLLLVLPLLIACGGEWGGNPGTCSAENGDDPVAEVSCYAAEGEAACANGGTLAGTEPLSQLDDLQRRAAENAFCYAFCASGCNAEYDIDTIGCDCS